MYIHILINHFLYACFYKSMPVLSCFSKYPGIYIFKCVYPKYLCPFIYVLCISNHPKVLISHF